jgi:peptidoglycan L-alanyl-D-glutamate endopeptidase CwlK
MTLRPLYGIEALRRSTLHPLMQKAFERLRQACAAAELDIFLVSGTRTFEEQRRIYDQGRITPGPIVTHAKPGTSYHNFGMAFDVCRCEGGTLTRAAVRLRWDWTMEPVAAAAKGLGLLWGGAWQAADGNHFQTDYDHLDLAGLQRIYPDGWKPGLSDPGAIEQLVPSWDRFA